VLHQGDGPMAFFGRQMAPRHSNLAAYKQELISLVQAVWHWQPYLWGRPIAVRTDHYRLNFLLDQHLSTIPQHQWASKLLGFDFRVEYKPGAMNTVADALSRRDTEESALALAISAPSSLFDELRAEYAIDTTLAALRQKVRAGTRGDKWAVVDDLVTYSSRIYVQASSSSLPALLMGAHGTGPSTAPTTLYTNAAPPTARPSHPPSGGNSGNGGHRNKNRNGGHGGGNNSRNSNSSGGRTSSSGQPTVPTASDAGTGTP
jgi:hypothetical protein